MLSAILLSGFIFPVANMPAPVRAVTLLVVPRYFVAALRKIVLKGAGFPDVWPELLAMVLLGVLFNLLAARATRKAL